MEGKATVNCPCRVGKSGGKAERVCTLDQKKKIEEAPISEDGTSINVSFILTFSKECVG